MTPIREWVERQLSWQGPKTIVEVGANRGQDTGWLAGLPGATVHAFEPDPRCLPLRRWGNVVWNEAAVGAECGRAPFILSTTRNGKKWTKSSSLRRPTGHLTRCPEVLFGKSIEVDVVTLDDYAWRFGIDGVDFLWCDAQGSEPDVIRGGQAVLARTKFAYMECPSAEEYEGQLPVEGLLDLLPERWRVVERYPYDVLLANLTV